MATDNAGATQADADASTSSQADNTTSTDSQALKSQQDYDKIIADLRRENAANRVKAKEFDDLQKKLENDKLTETERLTKQIADLQKAHDQAVAQAQQLKQAASVASTAARLGFADPDDAIRFLDASEIDANASNIESLLKDLLKSKPYLAGTQRASSGGATNPSRASTDANANITEDYVKRMLSGDKSIKPYEQHTEAQRQQITNITSRSRWR
jgi:hypothetical protein